MKILICGINYYPELTGIGKYSGEMASWLAERGHEVRMVAAPPHYPQWRVHAGYSAFSYKYEEIDGVRVWRCPLYIPGQPSGLKRIVHLLSFAMSSIPVMLRQGFWRPDVVISIEPPFFCAPISWLVSRLVGGKCLLHVQDLEIDVAFALGIFSSPRMRRWVAAMESWMMRRFDAVSTISASMQKRLASKGVRPDRLILFPNWADVEHVKFDSDGRNIFRREWQVDCEVTVALYSGNMARKQGLGLIVEAAERLKNDERILFVVCGNGPAKGGMEEQARKKQLTNIKFMSLQPLNKLAALLSAADVHLVIQTAGAADLVMPSKLTNILAVGGYSIATASVDTELGQLFSQNPSLGLLCPPDDVGKFVDAILDCHEGGRSPERGGIRAFAQTKLHQDRILSDIERQLSMLTASSLDEV